LGKAHEEKETSVQKLINDPDAFVDEMLAGVLLAHKNELRPGQTYRTLLRSEAPLMGKVAIATGGGSGHLPTFMGFVGPGLADGVAVGNVFASPSSDQMLSVIREVNAGRGVLLIYGNYGGDVMNFGLATQLAKAEGIEVETVVATDDIASAPVGEETRRRGIAGIFFLYKVAGAAAAASASLAEVKAVTMRAAVNLRSMGVALAPCTLPSAGRPTFDLPSGEMEIGMGIHGEPGVRRGPLASADEITDELLDSILSELPHHRDDRVDVLINGLGATPKEELYIIFRRLAERLENTGLTVRRAWIGEYATSLEMAGASISLLKVDDELVRLLDAPASSPFFTRL
jgi:dihydroxyacetone kinase-like protein